MIYDMGYGSLYGTSYGVFWGMGYWVLHGMWFEEWDTGYRVSSGMGGYLVSSVI